MPEHKPSKATPVQEDAASGISTNGAAKILAIPMLILIDIIAVVVSIFLAYLIRDYLLVALFPQYLTEKLLSKTFALLWWYPLAFVACLAYEKLYQKRLPFWIEVEWCLKAGVLTLYLSVVVLFMVQISEEVSRSFILLTWLFSIITIPFMRYYGKKLLLQLGIWKRPVVLIGNAYTVPLINNALNREKTMGYEAIGYIDNLDANLTWAAEKNDPDGHESPLKFLGYLDQAETIITNNKIEEIIIAEPGLSSAKLVELTNKLQPLVNNIILIPDLFGVSLSGIEAAYFFEEQAVLLHITNRFKSKFNRIIKRLFDLVAGFIFSLICLPLFILISIAVKLDSPGPVFYISTRIGQGGKNFRCFKFRTMYLESDTILDHFLCSNKQAREEWECYNKLMSEDPRVTRFGCMIRRFSLDELPQLINVIRGEMSLVGPRPYMPREREKMGSWALDILIGKPGLTGLWQVSGRNKVSFENRLKLDTWYMKNWSLWLDVVLILKTVRVIMKRDGAY